MHQLRNVFMSSISISSAAVTVMCNAVSAVWGDVFMQGHQGGEHFAR